MDAPLLNDKLNVSDEKLITSILADSYKYWEIIRNYLNENYDNIKEVWKYYYEKSEWLLQVVRQ